jgi:hypothetical protein
MSRVPQPPLSELLGRYLNDRAGAYASGMALPETFGEVLPHDAAPAQPIDPRVAWDEAKTALDFFHRGRSVASPPDWPALVVSHEPETALAFAAGNFPQLVRNLLLLSQTKDLTKLRPQGAEGTPVPALAEWAAKTLRDGLYQQGLLAIGALRLARQFDLAHQLIQEHEAKVPPAWRAAWANEQAALAWHRGQAEAAAASWLAQKESIPVLFNRGMAALFLGRPADGRAALEQAVAQLPEDSPWHHLGRLYLALAEIA